MNDNEELMLSATEDVTADELTGGSHRGGRDRAGAYSGCSNAGRTLGASKNRKSCAWSNLFARWLAEIRTRQPQTALQMLQAVRATATQIQ